MELPTLYTADDKTGSALSIRSQRPTRAENKVQAIHGTGSIDAFERPYFSGHWGGSWHFQLSPMNSGAANWWKQSSAFSAGQSLIARLVSLYSSEPSSAGSQVQPGH